ncbi:FAD binding domain-containing protein [Boeremia exigua]|uniref:FAD binding domain-containing protein n=1 Tax=Boeremia exigua TaxID=749465 RepID=UPI001E8DF283|nr:FAD binding domain-containing protein [Boeremia exigua]KAH6616649.1 FAD binding domain-containing protein [Boeremia exigua]
MAIPEGFSNGVHADEHHTDSTKPVEDVDLVIVGAGPTGLLSALLARQLGLSVCILDAKQGPLEVGGADAITARTQQYLEVASNAEQGHKDAGILGELLKEGVKCNTSTTYADGEFTSRQSKWWNGIPHTFYNNLLMIGQPYIERHFVSHIDTPIHYDEPALTFSHTTSPLSVTVQTAKRTVHAKYCLAADGARSFLRNKLNIGWEGTKPNMVWAVLDCWIDTTFPVTREIVTLQVDGESRMAWIPRERGMQRFYVLLDGEITQEKTEASIRRHMAPHPVEFTHVEWFSKFEIKERVASTFLHPTPEGPYILAGDAAHVHSVNGGQGMNTGLSDAFNLIWRLYFTLRRPSLPAATAHALISSYDTERRETAKGVIDVAAQLVRSTLADAKGYVELIEKNAGFITGMGVQYADVASPLVRASRRAVWTAGHRAPDLWLADPCSGHARRLYQTLTYGRYLLVVVGAPRARVAVAAPAFVTLLRLAGLKARRVGAQLRAEDAVEEETHAEAYGCSWVKSGDEYAVLVRPDCYVEFVGAVGEVLGYVQERLPGLVTLEG